MDRVAIFVATELETRGLPSREALADVGASLVVTGVGPVNAALGVARHLASTPVEVVASLGVGGGYPGSGLEPGDVACAESEVYADLGAGSPEGFLDMEALGFEVVGGHYNRLPLDVFPLDRRLPFVTRTTCTGTDAEAREIVGRTGGAVESMEGAAIVHAAIAHGVAVAEVRGISNPVGDRDRSRWKLHEAAEAAGRSLWKWLEER